MSQVIELNPEIRRRERIVTEFLEKIDKERRLEYIGKGDARERIERTLDPLFTFLVYHSHAPITIMDDLKTMIYLLEREALRVPMPTPRHIVERALFKLSEVGALGRNIPVGSPLHVTGSVVAFALPKRTART